MRAKPKKTVRAVARQGGTASSGSDASTGAASAVASSPAAPAATESAAPAQAAASTAPAGLMSSAVAPSKELPGEADLAARKSEWKYDGGEASGSEAADGAIPAGETAAPAVTPEPANVPAGETAAPAVAPASGTGGDDVAEEAPDLYTSPPSEGADDLKLISGVGPKLEQTLNELGIYRFAQVAAWGAAEIAWVDNRLRFKGRIERDDWMAQAKVLAEGGETEFSKRNK